MHVGVVGGNGNIAFSIVELLLKQGHRVTCFNRGRSGPVPSGAKLVIGDRVADRTGFERAMQALRLDAAVDMVCFTAEDAASSVRAFAGVRQFVHCSTGATYGVRFDWMPVTEDHPLRPDSEYGRGKVAADKVFLDAFRASGFPVTILKPATVFSERLGLIRQAGEHNLWIDRIRKGKPCVVSGDGTAVHQWMHTDDAAIAFAGVLGKDRCIGQVYNMVHPGYTRWLDYYGAAMAAVGRRVEMVGVPADSLVAAGVPGAEWARDVMMHNHYYSGEKLRRDVPEFRPTVPLVEAFERVIRALDAQGRIGNSDLVTWEDRLIEAQRRVGRDGG